MLLYPGTSAQASMLHPLPVSTASPQASSQSQASLLTTDLQDLQSPQVLSSSRSRAGEAQPTFRPPEGTCPKPVGGVSRWALGWQQSQQLCSRMAAVVGESTAGVSVLLGQWQWHRHGTECMLGPCWVMRSGWVPARCVEVLPVSFAGTRRLSCDLCGHTYRVWGTVCVGPGLIA